MSNSNDLTKQTNIEISPIKSAEKKDPDDSPVEEASKSVEEKNIIDKKVSQKDIKIKKKEKKVIQMELGQFIEIESPGNDDLDGKTFYINYLDENMISLINDIDNTKRVLSLNNGKITDESITAINILYSPEEKGYARQNDYITGKWITIEFGGDLPVIINGQITNLENDMIELSTYPDNEKIYINFEYKGIPKYLPIIEIRPFREPKVSSFIDELKDIDEKDSVQISSKLDDLKKSQSEQSSFEIIIDDDDYDDLDLNFDEDDKKEELDKIVVDSNSIILVEDEVIEDVVDLVEVAVEKRKYPLEFQINDMLDALLADYPTIERNDIIINNIYKSIDRYKDLREHFSDYSKDGMINSIKKTEKDFKPLAENLMKFENDLYWIIPIVKNRKKLYDVNILKDSLENDVIVKETSDFINDYNAVMKSYKTNVVPDDSKKYSYIRQQINNIQNISQPPVDRKNLINKIKVNKNVHTIVDNLDEFNSSVIEDNKLSQKKFLTQKYIVGEEMLYKDPMTKRKIYNKLQFIKNEDLYLKGFLMMPQYYSEISKLKLHNSNIYKKVLLHNHLKFLNILNNNELIKYNVDEDFEQISYQTNFLKEPAEISFIETRNYSDRNNDEVYKNFLDCIIPTTEKIIQNISGYLKKSTNNITFLKELEPFLVYYNNLSFAQYNLMNDIINNNIDTFKKTLAGRLLNLSNQVDNTYKESNILDKLFSGGDIIEESKEVEEKKEGEKKEEEKKEGEKKEGEKKEDDVSIKNTGINNLLKKYYNFEGKNMSNVDIIREIYNLDGGILLNTHIGLLQIDMRESLNLEEKLEREIESAEQKLAMENDPNNQCKNFVLTKTYNDIKLLQQDNKKEFVFYDKKYDNTPYDILNEFLKEKRDLDDEAFKSLLKNHLIKNVGVNPKMAERDSESMVIGQKRIFDGEYAVLDLGDYEYRYYERINNEWRLKDEYNDKMPDDSMFCNIKDKCLKINNNCGDENENTNKIHNILVNEIIENFSDDLEKSYEQISRKLRKQKKEQIAYLQEKIQFDKRDFLKKNNLMLNISQNINQEELNISPYSKLLIKVLSEKNTVNKYDYIIRFHNKFCRPYDRTNGNESQYWFYCVDTNFKLMPTFLFDLAVSYKENNFEKKLNKIVKERGIISDDGDKMVDKHSGYIIKFIEYDVSEGYNAEGYKIKSRDVLKDDDGDIIIESLNVREYSYKTKLSKLIYSILETLDKTIGFDTLSSYDFVVENTVKVLNNIISEERYKRKQKQAKQLGKKLKSYEMILNEKIIFSIMALYIISVQTAVPPIQTSKTFPGCKRNFSGFPLDDSSSNNGFIEYIVCICLKIKNDSRPWVALPNIRQNRDKKSNEKVNKFIIKFKKFITNEILEIHEVLSKIELKREWLNSNLVQLIVSDEFNIKKWSTFLPPLTKIKMDKIKMLGDSIKQKLDSSIRKKTKEQFNILNKINGKIKELTMYIIKNINNVVEREDKLFVTNSGMPYIENACCNDKNNNVYEYFVEKEGIISRDVNNVSKLSMILNKTKSLNKAKFLFARENTKIIPKKINNNFSEETIYRCFIKYCKYNTGIVLNPELESLCIKNTSEFVDANTIEEKIEIIKKENGDIYNGKTLDLLLKYLHRKNSVDIEFQKNIKQKNIIFTEILRYLQDKKELKICNLEIIPKILTLFEKYSIRYSKKQNDEMDELLLFIDDDIKIQLVKITDFFNKKSIRMKKRNYLTILKFLNKLSDYEELGTDIYMSKKDESVYSLGNQIKTMIKNMCNLYPNIILEQVSYKMYVPNHWNLSMNHQKKLEGIIYDEYSSLNEFYNNEDLIKLLNFIKINTVDLLTIVENIPFYSSIENKSSVMNNELFIKLHKYFFICTISLYIKLLDEFNTKSLFEIDDVSRKERSVEDVMLKGVQDSLEKNVANLLKEYIKIFIKRKKFITLSNKKIEKMVLKSKEKEKEAIRQNLKNLTKEARKIENVMKNNKLGRWSFGKSKAVFEYDPEQFDKERDEIERIALLEKRSGNIDDVTIANMEILNVGNEMYDYLEESLIDQREMSEVNNLDLREDVDADGEEDW